jgi:hypothetical protein
MFCHSHRPLICGGPNWPAREGTDQRFNPFPSKLRPMHNLYGPVVASRIATLPDLKKKLVADGFSERPGFVRRPATRAATVGIMTCRELHIFASN